MSEEEKQDKISVEDLQKALEEKEANISNIQKEKEAMKAKMEELLHETKQAKSKAQAEAEAKYRAEKERAEKNGEFEQLYKSSEEGRRKALEELEQVQNSIRAEKVKSTAMKIATELADGYNAEILGDILSRQLKYTEEGIKPTTESGELTVSSLEEFKQTVANSERFKGLLRGNKSSGGGAAGSGASSGAAGKEVPQAEFESWTMAKRTEFARNGGTVI